MEIKWSQKIFHEDGLVCVLGELGKGKIGIVPIEEHERCLVKDEALSSSVHKKIGETPFEDPSGAAAAVSDAINAFVEARKNANQAIKRIRQEIDEALRLTSRADGIRYQTEDPNFAEAERNSRAAAEKFAKIQRLLKSSGIQIGTPPKEGEGK